MMRLGKPGPTVPRVIALSLLWAMSFHGCGRERVVAILGDGSPEESDSGSNWETDDTNGGDTDGDADTDSSSDCPQDSVLQGSGLYQGSLRGASRLELDLAAECWTTHPSSPTDGPESIWELVTLSPQSLTIRVNQASWAESDCQLAAYLLTGCTPDPGAQCSSDQALCQGDATCVQGKSGPDLPQLTIVPADGQKKHWVVFDTNAACEGTFDFSVSQR